MNFNVMNKIVSCLMLFIATPSFCVSLQGQKGVSRPRVQDSLSVYSFLAKYSLKKSEVGVLRFDSLISVISNGVSPTTVFLFDSQGRRVKLPGATNRCAPEPVEFIGHLDRSHSYPFDPSGISLNQVTMWSRWLSGENKSEKSYDFTVILFWSIWSGQKVFKRDILSCYRNAVENKQVLIRVILINTDLQAEWGAENLSKVRFTKWGMELFYQ